MHRTRPWAALCGLLLLGLLLSACSPAATPTPTPAPTLRPTQAPATRPPATATPARSAGSSNSAASGIVAVGRDGKQIAPDASVKLPANSAAQKVGSLNVTIAISPYPPANRQAETFEIVLTDDKGQPVTDAGITLDLTMPSMPMPSNKITLQHNAQGRYQGQGRFTMRGGWRIEVIVQRGSDKTSAFFDLWL